MVDIAFGQQYSTGKRIAAVHAARTVTRYRLPREYFRELVQEALFELCLKCHLFDANRGSWRTFAEKLIANRLASVMRCLHADMRGYGKNEPLDDFALGLPSPDNYIDLRVDVGRVLARASAFDRTVALSLAECSATETSCRLGISRARVYRAITRLRSAFISAGIVSQRKRGDAQYQ